MTVTNSTIQQHRLGKPSSSTMHADTFAAIAGYAYRRSDLTANERLVLITLGTFMNASTLEAFPSNQTLAEMTGLSDKTVRRAKKGLEAKEIIESKGQRIFPDGSWSSNRYVLLIDPKADMSKGAGQDDQLNTHAIEVDKKTTNVSSKRSSLVSQTTPGDPDDQDRGEVASSLWIESLARKLSGQFADAMIGQGLKQAKYRSDAESDPWIYEMKAFVGATIGNACSRGGGLERAVQVYEEAIRIAVSTLDFSHCSATYVPPKVLGGTTGDRLVGEAVQRICPIEEASEESVRSPAELARRDRDRELAHEAQADSMERHIVGWKPKTRSSQGGKGYRRAFPNERPCHGVGSEFPFQSGKSDRDLDRK